ncbi:MAG: hypothetical protein LAO79_16965 [Acidobacteriia bacterium]|nr:hypothetical protein [Terriglobia bacterium]
MRSNPNSAREKVAALRDALLTATPEAIEACLPGLVQAASSIPDDPAELAAFKEDLRAVKNLVEHGEKVNRGLARILGAQIAGYTPKGEAAPVEASGSVNLKG